MLSHNLMKIKRLSKIDNILLWAEIFGSRITHVISYEMEWSHSIAQTLCTHQTTNITTFRFEF